MGLPVKAARDRRPPQAWQAAHVGLDFRRLERILLIETGLEVFFPRDTFLPPPHGEGTIAEQVP